MAAWPSCMSHKPCRVQTLQWRQGARWNPGGISQRTVGAFNCFKSCSSTFLHTFGMRLKPLPLNSDTGRLTTRVILRRLSQRAMSQRSSSTTRSVFLVCRKAICRAFAACRAIQADRVPVVRLRVSLDHMPEMLEVKGKYSNRMI